MFQAPETFRRVASDRSDVYSFGVTLWQLLSKQTIVYPDMHQHTIIFKVASSPDFNPGMKTNAHFSNTTTLKVKSKPRLDTFANVLHSFGNN